MSLVSKIGKGLKKGATAVYKPISAVEKTVRPIGKKIPIVGTFAQLHEDITEPLERKALGLKNKPNKTTAEKLATIATAKPATIAAQLKANGKPPTQSAIATVQANAAKALSKAAKSDPKAKPLVDFAKAVVAQKVVSAAKATGTPVSSSVASTIKSAASNFGVKAATGVYTVIKPDGTRVTIPAEKVR